MRRETIVAGRFEQLLAGHPGPDANVEVRSGSRSATDRLAPLTSGRSLDRRTAIELFEAMLQSRLQDLEARTLKDAGHSYYTIGSSGHEANAILGHQLRPSDPAFLHYRSGAFMIARARRGHGETPLFDTMLALCAAADDPISGGRHKVFGSQSLWVPPQTSTIASHLPKAVGCAYSLARMDRLGLVPSMPSDSVVVCSFGDASVNHATAQAGLTAAAAAQMHRQPCPILFVCEDNGLGISVRTPRDYIERCYSDRPGLSYFSVDGCGDLAAAWDGVAEAVRTCRDQRRPVFLHVRTARLLGHAGSDVETTYLSTDEIEANESRDPILAVADQLLRSGALTVDEMKALYADLRARVQRAGAEAASRRQLESVAEITAPLRLPQADELTIDSADPATRARIFGGKLPERDNRSRHLAFQLARGLRDVLAANSEAFVFGEDVAKKGGVYHVTAGLNETFGSGRVFNTILDETTILGLAQGMALAGGLPIPEIQYLAYIHNALDQVRGEAASLRFFSEGRFANPMVIRVAAFGYQKGFGGHFHNDNSIGALLDIPGLIVATPSRADDAVMMLRTCVAAARQTGAVCVFLEPIALYMTKDLLAPGDGMWQFDYPAPDLALPLGEPRAYDEADGDDLVIVSYANGLHLSLQAADDLRRDGIACRVLDLRWLAPLPLDAIKQHAKATGRALVVDECRQTSGGPSAHILSALAEDRELRGVRLRRLTAVDSYVPLGPAANLVLVQKNDIVRAARELVAEPIGQDASEVAG